MKIALSTIGKFHTFDLARELHARNALQVVYSGYPRFKLRNEGLPANLIKSYPWLHTPYMGFPRRERLGLRLNRWWEYCDKIVFDRLVSYDMKACDVFVGLSGSAGRSGRRAHALGAKYVCDRGSTHIRTQDQLTREEDERWGLPPVGVDPRVIELEEAEYAESDCITVPSAFNLRSFMDHGIAAAKLRRIPYGVNTERFHPTGTPPSGRLDILFVGAMSLRKGIPYLLQAYRQLQHPQKSLTLAGSVSDSFIALMKRHALWPAEVRVLGHVPQTLLKDIMSRSHVLVLPSIEEGLAMVQAQAMACGCPVIATEHSGAEDLFENERDGFIVPIRDANAISYRLECLTNEGLREAMSHASLQRVQQLGGWRDYGEKAMSTYAALT